VYRTLVDATDVVVCTHSVALVAGNIGSSSEATRTVVGEIHARGLVGDLSADKNLRAWSTSE